jgi:glutathione S-transferase
MKLFGGIGSPFVRKVVVTAVELDLFRRIDLLPANGSGTSINSIAGTVNPISKMPTLVLDTGESLFDSRMIMRFLNDMGGGALYPADDWAMVRRESVAEGLIEAALLIRYEISVRPEEFRWGRWIDGQTLKVNQALDAMERDASALSRLDAAAIGTGCALGYLDLRLPDWGWRADRPILNGWFDTFRKRQSMIETDLSKT